MMNFRLPPFAAEAGARAAAKWAQRLRLFVLKPSRPTSPQVNLAEHVRFELARGCPQHTFQYCWHPFTEVPHGP